MRGSVRNDAERIGSSEEEFEALHLIHEIVNQLGCVGPVL